MRYNSKRHRLPPFKSEGVLLIDKPAEWTSFDVVNFVRARFNIPKVGHCGTLDPAATGLLVLVLGKFTRLSQKFSGEDKIYEARIRIGMTTDSEDMDGEILSEKDWSNISADTLNDTLKSFEGKQLQTPPMVSAVKQDGKKLYELAREGKVVERESREIEIFSLDVNNIELPNADFTVHCSKGTYVRTICADAGEKLGCGAVLESLRRTKSGAFSLDDALTIETIKSFEQPELEEYLHNFMFEKLVKIAGDVIL